MGIVSYWKSALARGASVSIDIDRDACLALASPVVGCIRCRDRCPSGAISIDDRTIAADAARCLGCGQCAAICPTGAIAVAGFDTALGNASVFECARTNERQRVVGAAAVPCLGGVSVTSLLGAVHRLKRDIVLVDRGCCETCPAGGSGAPWLAQLSEANDILADFGEHRVHVEVLPLPFGKAYPLPEHLGAGGAARRNLFRAFIDPAPYHSKAPRVRGARKVDPRSQEHLPPVPGALWHRRLHHRRTGARDLRHRRSPHLERQAVPQGAAWYLYPLRPRPLARPDEAHQP
jgi:ferredoxin